MHPSTATARNHPAILRAVFLGLVGTGLLGYVVSGWLSEAPQTMPGVYGAAAGAQAVLLPMGPGAAMAMIVGFILLCAACIVLLRSRQGLAASALRDPLTGLHTRVYAAEALPGLAARDDRDGRSRLVLVSVEIDAIGELRHRYGGAAAQMVTGLVGQHIRSQTRETDLAVEPDEHGFAIYLHCDELDQARAFCRRLSTLLSSEQLECGGDVLKVSASMQVTPRRLGESIEALHLRAGTGSETAPSWQAGRIEA